jgi:glycosyltransferase involved in cell wall biosynthesis
MKVALIARSTLFDIEGGDTMQVRNTAKYLQELDVQTDIKKASERIDYSRYDLLHFFNITRPADILKHLINSGKPSVLSPIFIDYSLYDKANRKGFQKLIFNLFSNNGIEYIKTIARTIRKQDSINSTAYLWKGQKKSINDILSRINLLLPCSDAEHKEMQQRFSYRNSYFKIPLGIDTEIFKRRQIQKDKYLVLCVGRIEGIKNQLNLIRAIRNTNYRLILIGAPSPNHVEYYKQCKKEAGANVLFIEHLSQQQLANHYAKASVHVLPSFFENFGLATLEAAAMGCKVVISKNGFIGECLSGEAFYCDPFSPASILEAIDIAAKTRMARNLEEQVRQKFTWQQTAQRTLWAYQQVLQK